MSKPISRLWLLGPPAAILLSAFVYYAKFESVRRWVDARVPWVAENIGSRLQPFPDPSPPPSRGSSAPPAAAAERPALYTPPARPSFLAPDGTIDLEKLASDRSAWPATVTLKTAREFPAVANGKVVGKVTVPAGAEARLVSIQGGKLGLEYQGGGAWLTAEETDLAQRLRH